MRTANLMAITLVLCGGTAGAEQLFAEVGTCELESGAEIENCRVGYRTYGSMNAERSNVLVFPTWFSGKAADLERFGKIGPGLLADTDKYYVIAIDALGNGVSSSPSNATPAGGTFPFISIRDMVNSQHRLLTEYLDIDHVDTVLGISMGGMQVFEWARMYPAYMDNAVALDGSPKMTSYDLIQWQTHRDIIVALRQRGMSDRNIGKLVSQLSLLTLFTPEHLRQTVPPSELPAYLAQMSEGRADFSSLDYVSQLEAMIGQDVYRAPVAGVEDYAGRISARMLIVGAPSDHMVNAGPGRDLADAIDAEYLAVESACGHISSSCEADLVNARVAGFLAE